MGWEGRLESDEMILLSNPQFFEQSINFGTFPEFLVGYGTPVLADSMVILATFDIIAFGPGGIFFKKLDSPSSPWIDRPALIAGDNPNVLISMSYSFGDTNLPLAVIGSFDCPEPALDVQGGIMGFSIIVPSNIEANQVIKVMLAPETIIFQGEGNAVLLDEVTFGDFTLQEIAEDGGVWAISRAYPSFDSDNLVRVNKFGETIRLIDMSNIYYFFISSSEERAGLLEEFNNSPTVVWAIAPSHHPTDAVAVSDPLYNSSQWGLDSGSNGGFSGIDIDAQGAWVFTTGSPSVKVGIVDGPIYDSHPDLSGRVNNPYNINPDEHSNAVASVLAASQNGYEMVGVDWNCRIENLWDRDITHSNSDLVAAIIQGMISGVDILVHSYHTMIWDMFEGFIPGLDPSNKIACANAYNMGILNVCSTGNDDTDERYYPAGYNNISFAVGGINSFGMKFANANFGPYVDVVAPAEDITIASLYEGSTQASGTSYAAPFVGGVASLLLAEFPSEWGFPVLWPHDLMAIMRITALDLEDDEDEDDDDYFGQGLVQAGEAIKALKGTNELFHGVIWDQYFEEFTTLGPVTTLLYGFDGIYDGALCRVTYHWMRAEGLIPPLSFAASDTVYTWERGYSAGYSYESPVYNYGWGAVSYHEDTNTISASTFILDVLDLNTGLHHTFPPSGEVNVKFSALLVGGADPSAVGAAEEKAEGLIVSPNPFNAKINIEYHGVPGEKVLIEVFDLKGRRVKELYSAACPEGPISLKWLGLDQHGRSVSSGVYFLTLSSGSRKDTKKIILAK